MPPGYPGWSWGSKAKGEAARIGAVEATVLLLPTGDQVSLSQEADLEVCFVESAGSTAVGCDAGAKLPMADRPEFVASNWHGRETVSVTLKLSAE